METQQEIPAVALELEPPAPDLPAVMPAAPGEVVELPPGATVRQQIEALEDVMLELPQVECPLEHHFAPGLYARQITIPAGVMCTGKIHKDDDISVLLEGVIDVLTPDGFKRMVGPCTFVSKAGVKKLGYAHTQTVWTTIHHNPTDETDVETLEGMLVHNDKELAEVLAGLETQLLERKI